MKALLGAAALLALAAAACGGGNGVRQLEVTVDEWSVTPASDVVREGRTRFVVTNQGATPHEFVIIKSDLPPHGLPVEDGKVVEAELNVVDEIEPFAPGTVEEIEMYLSPGKYLLICNIVERPPDRPPVSHYENGMVSLLLVEP